jgi:thioredoxin reductase (NADPH)
VEQGMDETMADVAIVGAGPIGLELAVACKQAGLSVIHFDARQIAHTISWFAPQTRFFSSNERIAIAGVPLQTADQGKASREEYLAYLRGVVQQFDLRIRTFEPVAKIERREIGFEITTRPAGGERTYKARRIVLSTGGTERPRRLNIPGEDLPHVSHYFQDPHVYFRRRLLIVGGRNSAVEAAIRCHRAGSEVAVSYYGAALDPKSIKYWLMPEIADLLEKGKIQKYFQTRPVEIAADHVTLRGEDGGISNVPADFVLLLIGYEADMSLCRAAGVELIGECQTPRFDERTMESNVPGVFVAGTAVGGTQQRYRVFIENCHIHVARIMAAILGTAPPAEVCKPVEGLET